MGKSSKSKRKKNLDFARVKVKIGRKLKKANATDVSFKAKTLILPQQFASTDNKADPVTHRKLNLQDLLLQLSHHNANTRKEALLGLKELLVENAGVILANLTQLIEHLVRGLQDNEKLVRSALLNVFKVIFAHTRANDVLPHVSLLTANICCAMTHLNEGVKIFALHFADLFITAFPSLASNSWSLLETLLGSVSSNTSQSTTSTIAASVAGYRHILTRERKKQIVSLLLKLLRQLISFSFDSNPPISGPPFLIPLTSSIGDVQSHTNMLQIAEKLFPFLRQFWSEIVFSEGESKVRQQTFAFEPDSLAVILSILELLRLLIESIFCGVHANSNNSLELTKRVQHSITEASLGKYICVFPCELKPAHQLALDKRRQGKLMKTEKNKNPSELCAKVNLQVCWLALSVCHHNSVSQQSLPLATDANLESYVHYTISSIATMHSSAETVRLATTVLLDFLKQERIGAEALSLSAVKALFDNFSNVASPKIRILKIIRDFVVSNEESIQFYFKTHGSCFIHSMCSALAECFDDPSHEQIFDPILALIRLLLIRGLASDAVQSEILAGLNIYLSRLHRLSEQRQMAFLSLFYWLPQYSPETLVQFQRYLTVNPLTQGVRLFLLRQIMCNFFERGQSRSKQETTHFLRFLLTLMLPMEEVDEISANPLQTAGASTSFTIVQNDFYFGEEIAMRLLTFGEGRHLVELLSKKILLFVRKASSAISLNSKAIIAGFARHCASEFYSQPPLFDLLATFLVEASILARKCGSDVATAICLLNGLNFATFLVRFSKWMLRRSDEGRATASAGYLSTGLEIILRLLEKHPCCIAADIDEAVEALVKISTIQRSEDCQRFLVAIKCLLS